MQEKLSCSMTQFLRRKHNVRGVQVLLETRNKKESNVGGGASLTANYPQGSTELGVGGIIPIKKNKYFGGAAGINVKQKIPTKHITK